MIPRPLDQITEADLAGLITAAVPERRTLDYKQQLHDTNDAGKRELLADVSSFANTAGGELIFGMTENGGVPTGIPGVQIGDPDQEVLRLDSIIRTGLSPRIQHTTKAIRLASGLFVLIIRSERSWYGPHRVIFKGDGRFYGRTSNGKYELDVTDLRNAFLFTSTATEKMAAFRSERIIALENGQALAPLTQGPKLALHVLPLESFGGKPQYAVMTLAGFHPIHTRLTGWGERINFEGKICIGYGESAYTQVFRNGAIEAVRVGLLDCSPRDSELIPSVVYEEAIVDYVPHCFEILRNLGCQPPVFVGISLIGVRGSRLAVDYATVLAMGDTRPIDRDVLMLPDTRALGGPFFRLGSWPKGIIVD